MKPLVKEAHDTILDFTTYGNEEGVCEIFYSPDGKKIIRAHTTACHAGMNCAPVLKSSLIASSIHHMWKEGGDRKTRQQFLDWLSSPLSVYKPLFDYLGDNIHWVKDKEGYTRGVVVSTNEVNTKVLQNFFKATRTTSEHFKSLDLWKKYYGKIPEQALGLLWMLGYYFDKEGKKRPLVHSVFEAKEHIDINMFLNPNHKKWDLTKDTAAMGKNYYGESEYVFTTKPNFKVYDSIRKAGARTEVKTLIYSLYQKKKLEQLSEEDFMCFFQEAVEGRYS